MRIFKIFTNPSYNKIYIPFPFIDIYYFQWNKNQQTSIHNHASKGCLMFLFNGELKEYLYSRDLELKKYQLINPRIYHILIIKKVIIL